MAMTDLELPFEPLADDAAVAVLAARYGIPNATVARLATERDDSFHVTSEYGEFVLKVAHPADDPLLVNLQTSAMAFANEVDPAIPLQRVLPSLDGEIEAVLETDAGERVMRVLTWLPGGLMRGTTPTPDQLFELGEMQGRLAAALEDFRHPAAQREFAWSVEHLAGLRPMLAAAPELTPAFERFTALHARIAALPHQVVHNDINFDNTIVDPASAPGGYVTGIIDFGDALYTARAIDLGVTASYLIDPAVGLPSIEPLVEGYRTRNPLLPVELELLPELIRGRLVQRVLIPAYLQATAADGAAYANRSFVHTRAQFESLPID
jgi:Ser/Thr protein kinase RdoA (MazF antagonist)